ncbi:MAG: hypothetical protein ACLRZ9_01780 [Eubacterium sp.]
MKKRLIIIVFLFICFCVMSKNVLADESGMVAIKDVTVLNENKGTVSVTADVNVSGNTNLYQLQIVIVSEQNNSKIKDCAIVQKGSQEFGNGLNQNITTIIEKNDYYGKTYAGSPSGCYSISCTLYHVYDDAVDDEICESNKVYKYIDFSNGKMKMYDYKCTIYGHNYCSVITKATIKKNGKKEQVCNVCGHLYSKTTIYHPKVIKLSKKSFKYNGKKHVPKVIIKDMYGRKISSSNYKLVYKNKKSKKVGKYYITVKFKGKYSGSKKLKYTIKRKTKK